MAWSVVPGGDFNEVMEPSDTNGGGSYSRNMIAFANFMDNVALWELPISGTKYVWSNMQEVPHLSKLNRFFPFNRMGFPISFF